MKRLSQLTIAVALLLVASATHAELRKCVGADGRVSYGDQPCAADAKAASVRPPSTPDPASAPSVAPRLSAGTTITYYDVDGIEHAVLLRSLNARGPKGFHGYAEWRVAYRYETIVRESGCAVSKVGTTMSGNIIMPRWVKPAGVPAALVERWQRYEAALLVHEEGHLAHGRELARVLEFELPNVVPAADCHALDQAVRKRYEELFQQYRARDREYDLRTGHGRTQGAVF